jgi:hemolysin activation/secretion protein
MAGSLELRFDQPLSLPYTTGYQLYGFVESGAAWNVGYSYTDGLSLTSAGAGLRVFFEGDLRADIGVAFPLSYRAADNDTRSARLLFSLSNSFRLCPERALFRCS